MIKKVWILISLGLFFVVTPSYCLEYNGMSAPYEIINNLSPATIKNLSPGVLKQLSPDVVKSISRDKGTSQPADSTVPSSDTVESVELAIDNKETGQNFAAQNVSVIEKQYRYGYSSLLTGDLQQFGYDIFRSAKAKPSSLAVPDKNYILGTGDNLLIRLWGTSVDVEYPAVVDREGVINVPKIGPIPVAGVKYGDVESVVKKEAEKYIQGININITLIELRSLEIYVVGEVKNPGLHMLPAFSTIFDGLLYAGGVKKTGTLRKIKLYRNDIEIQLFDLYDLLLKGNRKSDTTLNNKDVIFVGEIGKTAAVAGAVNNQAIFEITGTRSIKELANLAGGVLPQAFGDRIYLRRFDKHREFVVQDINMEKTPDAWNRIKVRNGDLLELDFLESTLPYVVRLSGNVWKPDIFNYQAGMNISDVLTTPDLLMPDSLTKFALIVRYDRKTTRTRPMRFPLSKVFPGKYDAPLQPYDKIIILSREKIGITENIHIAGAVWNGGQYNYQPGLRLKDALALAGGLKFGAGTERIEVARQVIKDSRIETVYVMLGLETDGEFLLQPNDSIMVPRVKDASLVKKITLTGDVRYPGTYTIRENESVSDLISRAGGFTEDAYFYGAKYTSEKARKIQQNSINKMIDKLQLSYLQTSAGMTQTATSAEDAKSAEIAGSVVQGLLDKLRSIRAEGRVAIKLADLASFKGSLYDFRLQDGDTLDIPQKPAFVSVVGSVYSPGSFLYQPNKRLDFYLGKSGGAAKTADKKYIYLLKANGEIASMAQKNGFFQNFGNTVLMPGDTIVVPENLERVPYLKIVKDISDIVFKIATTAGIAFAI